MLISGQYFNKQGVACMEFIEFKNFSFNFLTISFLFTGLFTVFQFSGFYLQARLIWSSKKAESLSLPLFSLFLFYFFDFLLYGIEKNSLAMIFNGLLFVPCISIVAGILKYKKLLTTFDYSAMAFFGTSVPVIINSDNPDAVISILLIFSLLAIISQFLEIKKNRQSGSIEIRLFLINFSTSVFWLAYSIGILNCPLIAFNAAALIIYGAIIVFYFKYKKTES